MLRISATNMSSISNAHCTFSVEAVSIVFGIWPRNSSIMNEQEIQNMKKRHTKKQKSNEIREKQHIHAPIGRNGIRKISDTLTTQFKKYVCSMHFASLYGHCDKKTALFPLYSFSLSLALFIFLALTLELQSAFAVCLHCVCVCVFCCWHFPFR